MKTHGCKLGEKGKRGKGKIHRFRRLHRAAGKFLLTLEPGVTRRYDMPVN
jgi:hypothetical protein